MRILNAVLKVLFLVTQDMMIKCQKMIKLSSNTFKLHAQKNSEGLFYTSPDEIVAQGFVEAIGSETVIFMEEKSFKVQMFNCGFFFFFSDQIRDMRAQSYKTTLRT